MQRALVDATINALIAPGAAGSLSPVKHRLANKAMLDYADVRIDNAFGSPNAFRIDLAEYCLPDTGEDCTAAIQAAINYAATLGTPARILCRPGIYLISGALDSLSQSQLYVPDRDFTGVQVIEIVGAAIPDLGSYAGLNNSFTEQAHATVFQSTITGTGAVIGARASNHYGYGNFTYCQPHFENLVVRVKAGTAMGGINAYRMVNASAKNVVTDIDGAAWASPAPPSTLNQDGRVSSTGITGPKDNNNTVNRWDDCTTYGFHTGLDGNEHCTTTNLRIICNTRGLYHNNANHASHHGRVVAHWNREHVVIESADCRVNIAQLVCEAYDPANLGTASKWYDTIADIRGGHARGEVVISMTNHEPISQNLMKPVLVNCGNMELYVMAALGNWVNESEFDETADRRHVIRGTNGGYNTNYLWFKYDNARGTFIEHVIHDTVQEGNKSTTFVMLPNSMSLVPLRTVGIASNGIPYYALNTLASAPASQNGELRFYPTNNKFYGVFGDGVTRQFLTGVPAPDGGTVIEVNYSGSTSTAGVEHYDGVATVAKVSTVFNAGTSTVDRVWSHQYNGGYTGNEIMRLKGNGNLALGTTAAASRLTVAGGDVEVTGSASGVILKSPNGTRYRISVDNAGALSTAVV